jgi:hypothetical protein
MTVRYPRCLLCAHFTGTADEPTCEAFPLGIPQKIWANEQRHTEPIEGDNGIQYKDDPELLKVES